MCVMDKGKKCFLYVSNMNHDHRHINSHLLHIILHSKHSSVLPAIFHIEQLCEVTLINFQMMLSLPVSSISNIYFLTKKKKTRFNSKDILKGNSTMEQDGVKK